MALAEHRDPVFPSFSGTWTVAAHGEGGQHEQVLGPASGRQQPCHKPHTLLLQHQEATSPDVPSI